MLASSFNLYDISHPREEPAKLHTITDCRGLVFAMNGLITFAHIYQASSVLATDSTLAIIDQGRHLGWLTRKK